jgi:hypothetical protein
LKSNATIFTGAGMRFAPAISFVKIVSLGAEMETVERRKSKLKKNVKVGNDFGLFRIAILSVPANRRR